MPNFLIVYLGGNPPSDPEEGQQHFGQYMAWLSSLGEAAVSPMNPLKNTTTVSLNGVAAEGGASGMSGYTIVKADSIVEAVAMAKSCPFLDIGGTLEVSEMVEMPG